MKKAFFLFLVGIIIIIVYVPKTWAEDGLMPSTKIVESVEPAAERADWQKWQRLSPQKRARLKERYYEYQQLSPEEKEKLQRNLRRFRRLSPEKKDQLRKRYRFWQSLPAEEREALRQQFQRQPKRDIQSDTRPFRGPSRWQSSSPRERGGFQPGLPSRDYTRGRGHQ